MVHLFLDDFFLSGFSCSSELPNVTLTRVGGSPFA
jgi:hypothetical protein